MLGSIKMSTFPLVPYTTGRGDMSGSKADVVTVRRTAVLLTLTGVVGFLSCFTETDLQF